MSQISAKTVDYNFVESNGSTEIHKKSGRVGTSYRISKNNN